jgi:hypothetical protein
MVSFTGTGSISAWSGSRLLQTVVLAAGYGLGLVTAVITIASMLLVAKHSKQQPRQLALAIGVALLPAATLAAVYAKRDEFHLSARTPSIAIAQFENRPVNQITVLATTSIDNGYLIAYTGTRTSSTVIEWAIVERKEKWMGDSWRFVSGISYPTTTLPVSMFLPFGPDNGEIAITGAITPGWQATVIWRDGTQQIATSRNGLLAVVRTKASADLSLQPPTADWTRLESARIYLTDNSGVTTMLKPKWYWGKPEPGVPASLTNQ